MCDDVQLFRSQLEGMKQIVELYISDCNSLTSFPFGIFPTTLETITISNCKKLKLDPPVGEMFLEYLSLFIDDISPELLPTAHKLSKTLRMMKFPSNYVHYSTLSDTSELAESEGSKVLDLRNCLEIESFPRGGLPFNLQQLEIHGCKKLRLPYLTELSIYHDGSDEDIKHWELCSSIQSLDVRNMKTLSNQLLKILTSLQHLCIEGNLPQIQSMLEQGQFSYLTSLQSLQISNTRIG
ncbi:hypothetical protein H5410_001485 [Solanum commersonii]|uniref:Uncharacterized protein n=1 Tax=Solanum commersonii TaxID=4109 RepID=A0A9J6AZ67_SOLCO|nr:hypothetical protein H5410_001485 [Solanum commersonii]